MKKFLCVCLVLFLISGCSVTPIKDLENDGNRFSEEYASLKISKNNPMVYKTDKEIIQILKSGTGIIYFGFPDCPWCQEAVPVLLKVAKEMDIDKIYYFNPSEIRDNETASYKEIVKLLGSNLTTDENGKARLYVPDVYFVSGGKIIGHNLKTVTSQLNPTTDPLTDTQKTELKLIYKRLISKTYNIQCDC